MLPLHAQSRPILLDTCKKIAHVIEAMPVNCRNSVPQECVARASSLPEGYNWCVMCTYDN